MIVDTAGVSRGVRDAEAALDRLNRQGSRNLDGLKRAAAGAGIALGALSVKLGKDSVEAALESERVMARVQRMVESAGVSWKDHAAEVDKALQAHSRLSGFDDEQLAGSFANFTRVTKDVNQALKLNALAADVARGRNISLEQAANTLIRVYNGNEAAAKRLGVQVDKNATSTQVLGRIQQQFAGQAEAYGKTTQGSVDRMNVAWENLKEQIGAKLLPVLSRLVEALTAGIDWVQRNGDAIKKWAAILAPLAGTIGGVALAVAGWRKAQLLLNAALSANPLVRGAMIIGGIATAFAAAYERSKPFRDIVDAIVGGLRDMARYLQDSAIGRLLGIESDRSREATNRFVDRVTSGRPGALTERRTGGGGFASGGMVPGPRGAGDVVSAMLTPGEVILNERQQNALGRSRIMDVLRRTGGRIGGGAFATGGVAAARSFAEAQLGEPYGRPSLGQSRTGPSSWDCSGYAGAVARAAGASITAGGTTATYFAQSSPAKGNEPIVFGFWPYRSGYDGGYDEHMGIRIGGQWYESTGSAGVRRSSRGDSWWSVLRVPNGLRGLADGDGGMPLPQGGGQSPTGRPRPAATGGGAPTNPLPSAALGAGSRYPSNTSMQGKVERLIWTGRNPPNLASLRRRHPDALAIRAVPPSEYGGMWRAFGLFFAPAAPTDAPAGDSPADTGGGTAPDTGALDEARRVADQAGARAAAAEARAATGEANLRVFTGSGDIGAGYGNAFAAATGGVPTVVINMQSLVAGSPADAARLGQGVVSALGGLAGVPAARLVVA